ncbi:dihydrodipicolinate synthase family protein [Rossellomorea marisflavi]|uniref:dihydrodipicolinate synthase family protein n=1 Tax=Rossellomorea marisflavi TaxID=189381 RepID=UPI0011E65CD4|nr:dihydrodipicolinate synthase family protein [Rossellomorea marisflavi]TYO68976.1 dihydrodipicolinate synthase family protein [Rossellomorea marisflavi]
MKEAARKALREGAFIPAHPLALQEDRTLDEAGQRALTRYYIEAGVGGIAVGVHTTQFEIRDRQFNLYERVLQLAIEECEAAKVPDSFIRIAGVCGPVEQALHEATVAKKLGYDLVLLSMGGLGHLSEKQLLERTEKIASVIPVFGFYLQPAVGGRILSYGFWEAFSEIPGVYAIKIAPFNRYLTLDVVRAVVHSTRSEDIALYTGNDDNIVMDLLTPFRFDVNGTVVEKQIVGGLLGHWSVWTERAVAMFREIKEARGTGVIPVHFLPLSQEVTDANGAFFDARNGFKGSIAGINQVLAAQGILKGRWCLMEHEELSPGQLDEIDRVTRMYPHLKDDAFVQANVERWRQIP